VGHCRWGLEGGGTCTGENFNLVITFALNRVKVGRGLVAFCLLLPLLNNGPSAKGEKVPSCQHGLKSLTI